MTATHIGLVGLGLFVGYYLYIVLNWDDVNRSRRERDR